LSLGVGGFGGGVQDTSARRVDQPSGAAQPAAGHQSLDLADGIVEVVVHHAGVELGGKGLLGVGLGQAPPEVGRVDVRIPIEQPTALHFTRGRPHEDQERVGERLPHGHGSLDVDLQQDVVTQAEVLLDGRTGRPLQIAVDVEALEEAPRIPDVAELLGADEQVVAPIDLAGAARAVGR